MPTNPAIGTIATSPSQSVKNTTNVGGLININTQTAHGKTSGDKVFISGVVGTTEANNAGTNRFWTVDVVDTTNFTLRNSAFVNPIIGSTGNIFPALFQFDSNNNAYDTWFIGTSAVFCGRTIGLISDKDNTGAAAAPTRYWGEITGIIDAAHAIFKMSAFTEGTAGLSLPNTSAITNWQLSCFSRLNGFPSASCFHQDRLGLVGASNNPQQVNFSQTGLYERFAASGSSLQVADNNAIQFNLNSADMNQLFWVKSSQQSLLSGSYSAEWSIAPNTQAGALTPTNVNASQTSYFGSADIDAVQSGNATIYVQRSGRKVRELNYFFNVGTFRSTDMTEIAEHITIPQITKLAVQKESLPLVWGARSDGNLVSMSYDRDDQSVHAGWARHELGGQSDSGGTNPVVKSIACMPATANSSSFDQLWMVVQRSTLSGSTFTSIEYMTKPYDDAFIQEDAFFGDCGATYDSPVTITNISTASSAIVTAALHGFSNGDQIRIVNVVGLNSSAVNGTITNLVNEQTFTVGSSLTNTFALLNFGSSAINSLSYSAYVSSGQVRKMVQTISGLTWLAGETVGVLADGANHPDCIVSNSGLITLNYRAAKVQIGYRYNSDGQDLRQDSGSAQGSAIGETSRTSRVAVQLHNVGEFQMGASFDDLLPVQLVQADQQQADQAMPLFSGIIRDGVGAGYDFDGFICWRQNSMLPGMVQSITSFFEVQDV